MIDDVIIVQYKAYMKRKPAKRESVPVTYRINLDLIDRLRQEARKQRRSQTAILEIALESLFSMNRSHN